MFPRHCSDEQLLAHLDGELSRRRDGKVRKHLERCWPCRVRLAELEEQVRSLTRAFEKQAFPGEDRIAGARSRFERGANRYERSLVPGPRLHLLPEFSARVVRIGAFCLAILAAVIAALPWRSSNRLAPDDVLTAMSGVERGIYQSAEIVHQVLRIEVRQTEPRRAREISRLEVWAEPNGPRFATKWRDDRGTVRYAAWRPDSDHEYILAPGLVGRGTPARTASFVSIGDYGLEPEQIERALLEWLQTREWKPVSLTSNFRSFCSGDGAVMGVEQRSGTLRLWARRTSGVLRMEIVMDIDAATFRPRLQAIRFEDASQKVEVRLIAERIVPVSVERLKPSVFEPDPGLSREEPGKSREKPVPLPSPGPRRVTEADYDEIETEVLYSLHRVGACLGEPIEVERVRREGVRVSGLVETTFRRAQLLAALGELQSPHRVTVDIQTAEEYSRPSRTEGAHGPDVAAMQVGPLRPPIQDELERYFEQRGETPRRAVQLANEAIDISKAMLAEAWALRRLGERYDGEPLGRLKPRSRWLVEVMLRDHMEAFRVCSRRGQAELGPVLASISSSVRPEASPPPSSASPPSLLRRVMALFNKAEEVDVLTRGLFAGEELPVPAGEAAAGLWAAFKVLEDGFQRVSAQVNGEFSGHPDLRSGEARPETNRMP